MNLGTVSGALAIAAAAALWTCAAATAGTIATDAEGEIYTGTIKAGSQGSITIDGTVSVTCNSSNFEGAIEEHGPEGPAKGKLSSLTFSECGNHTVTVTKPGTLELNATSEGDGTLTSTGPKSQS